MSCFTRGQWLSAALTLGLADEGDVWCTKRNQRARERSAGGPESCLRVIWRTEGGKHGKLGDVRRVGVLLGSGHLYHFLPGGNIRQQEETN